MVNRDDDDDDDDEDVDMSKYDLDAAFASVPSKQEAAGKVKDLRNSFTRGHLLIYSEISIDRGLVRALDRHHPLVRHPSTRSPSRGKSWNAFGTQCWHSSLSSKAAADLVLVLGLGEFAQ